VLDRITTYRAPSLSAAVQIAQDFKRGGKYDWFRGQTHEWPLCPTLNRLDEEHRNRALIRLANFAYWLRQQPELGWLDECDVKKLAVAQHYGIPTNLLDFTTDPEVAGFFATHGSGSSPPPIGYMLCLSPTDLLLFWETAFPDLLPLKITEVDVPDLWRLHAQRGVFLDCPYANLEDAYAVDRIVFPNVGGEQAKPVDHIYPNRKSRLELLLEEFFDTERQQAAFKMMRTVAKKNDIVQCPSLEQLEGSTSAGNVPFHDSWRVSNSWWKLPAENFLSVGSKRRLELRVDNASNAIIAGEAVADRVLTLLRSDPNLRHELVIWEPLLQTHYSQLPPAIQLSLTELWDGLRTYPYSDDDLAAAMGTCLTMQLQASTEAIHGSASLTTSKWEQVCRQLFGEIIEVAFGGTAGGSCRCFVPVSELARAIRSDLMDVIPERHREYVARGLQSVLFLLPRPQRLFEFDRFAKFFCHYLAPMQVCQGFDPKIYTPAGIKSFGLP